MSKYFGNTLRREGGLYDSGFHWGYIAQAETDIPLERYVSFVIPLPGSLSLRWRGDADKFALYRRTFAIFIAWPTQLFRNDFSCPVRISCFGFYWAPQHKQSSRRARQL